MSTHTIAAIEYYKFEFYEEIGRTQHEQHFLLHQAVMIPNKPIIKANDAKNMVNPKATFPAFSALSVPKYLI